MGQDNVSDEKASTDTVEAFPRPKPDRRHLSDIPSRNSSRRKAHYRYIADMDVEIFSAGRKWQKLSAGKAMDISDNGLLARFDIPLADNDKVCLKFSLKAGTMPEGYESVIKTGARVARVNDPAGTVAFQFDSNISDYLEKGRWRHFEALSIFGLFVVLLLIVYIKQESIFYFRFDIPVFLYGLCAVTYLLTRFLFSAFYRPQEITPGYLPSVSIVIPCFNEGEWIHKTIITSLNQSYPEDLLEVIVVDDGSTDNSLQEINRIKNLPVSQVRNRMKVISLTRNQGKRHALAAGTRNATGELVIFVDSDSFLEPDAVVNIVQPLKDSKIAAVCGHCEVENKWTNFLSKMQAVRYFVGFRIFKAAESVFDSVTCLSGPLSCYRKSVVLEFITPWINQTFMGKPATFGDDRSLTNFLLKKYRAVYQSSAVCTTLVPSTYRKFYRQQMRWKRSWLRESLRAAAFMWRKEPFMAISFYLGFFLPILGPFVVLRAFVFVPVVYGIFPYMYLVGVFLMSMLMSASYLFIKRSNLWYHGAFFCFFYLFVLLWQMIPAMVTFWKSDWGTRPSKYDPVDTDTDLPDPKE